MIINLRVGFFDFFLFYDWLIVGLIFCEFSVGNYIWLINKYKMFIIYDFRVEYFKFNLIFYIF